jgi:hypothetical protein
MEASPSSSPRIKRRGWLRKALWLLGIFLVLAVLAGFVVTSSGFFKGVILPRVGAAINAKVTVSDASIRPFSQVTLKEIQVTPNGAEMLLTAKEFRLRYNLMAILRGNLVVNELTLESPMLQVIQNADGTSNLDPILSSQPSAQPSTPTPDGEVESPRIDIQQVKVTNATMRLVKHYAGGHRDLTELNGAHFTLEDLKNVGTGRLELGGNIQLDQNPPAPGTVASLRATFEGQFRFDLATDLQPGAVQGNTRLDVQSANGSLGDLTALQLLLVCDWTPTEIRELALRLQRAGVDLAAMTVKGPFDATKGEGRLGVELWGVDRQLLNLAGAPWGAQFNDTKLASTNQIGLGAGGEFITASGQLMATDFSVTQTGQTTPRLDFAAEYDLTLKQSVLEMRTARLNLAPTARGKNQLDLSGRVDYSRLNAITGALKLAAESLDLTTLYDNYPNPGAATGATPLPEQGPPAEPEVEPPAVTFPFQDFICEAVIGELYLHELKLTNFVTRLRVDGGRIVLDPFRLNFNGEPVEASMDLDLGVEGFAYESKVNIEKLSLEPLINTFLPKYRGQVRGDLIGHFQIKGAGTTEASLRRNLSGQNSLSFTNAAIQTAVLTNMFAAMERSPNFMVRTAWRLFEPASIPFKIISPILTSLSSKLSLGDLSNLPLNGIDAQASIRQGNINTACNLWSSAFLMSVGGDVAMETVLTNSPIRNWPVQLSLARALARKIPYLAANAPTNAAYVALPTLFTVKGTLGSPTTSFDTATFAQWTAQSLLQGRTIGGVDAGSALQGLSDLLGGKKPDGNAGASQPTDGSRTNAPASTVNKLLDLLKPPPEP